MRPLTHFYHLYQAGNWVEAVTEHTKALVDSGLADELSEVRIGLVGTDALAPATVFLDHGIQPVFVACAPFQWEQLTINKIREHVIRSDDYVLYAHTKGSANESELNTAWRRSMTYYMVMCWREAVEHLSDVETVGCHWIEEGNHWGGNFWWARSQYLRTLPKPSDLSRFFAESWMSANPPSRVDMNPGWPAMERFTTQW